MRSQSPVPLRFSPEGKFRILAIGDSHEKYSFDEKTEDMLALLNRAAEDLKPDLAIFMGDLVSRKNDIEDRLCTEEEVFQQVVRLTKPFTSRNIPVGIAFGNHDGDYPEHKEVQYRQFQRIANFVNTDESGVTGIGNCFVPIYDHRGKKMLFNLWLMDSGSGAQDGGEGYAWVDDAQIDWYERTCDEITAANGGKVVPAILFQHIPVCEEYELLRKTSILNPFRVKGLGMFADHYYTKGPNCYGYLGEGPACPAKNNGQFASWKKKGDVFAAFFGHDHMNDFVGEVDGILLGQTKCSGFHIYGDGLHQGVRVIDLDETRPCDLTTYMVYYRDFFGTKCNSIHGYNLLTDRWHTNFKITLGVLGTAAVATGIGAAATWIVKHTKKK
ncbi:MAG: metallophosphoesterase [Oscillospiraceae bacterium]|nr:metallophosphoesterase [Oscillospiraceae bacterium]